MMKKFTKFIAMMTALLMVFGCFTACSNTKTKDDEKSSKKSSRDKDDDDDDDDDEGNGGFSAKLRGFFKK